MSNDQSKKLVVDVVARISKLEKEMDRAKGVSSKGMKAMEDRAKQMSGRMNKVMGETFKSAQGNIQGFADRLGPAGSAMSALGPAGLTAAAGIGALVLGLSAGLSSAAQADMIFRRLDAVLKLSGNAAGFTAGQLNDFANELQRATGIAATEINSAAAGLATFTNISGERFKGIIKLSTDMVAVYGGNLREWSDKIARAIDDPVQGFAALKRAGFQLTDSQLDLVEGMRKVGDVAGYQSEMIKILSDSLGGAAASQNQGMAGAATRAKNAVVGFLEAMSQWGLIKGPVEATLNGISSGLENLAAKAERMRQIELDVGINVVSKNRDLLDLEDRLQKMQNANTNRPGSFAPDQVNAVRQEIGRLEAEIDSLIQRGHQEVADLAAVEVGERVAQWGAATDLIKDNAKAASEAANAYLSTSEKLGVLSKSYDDTKGKIAEARQLWQASAADLLKMSDEERAAYDARGKAIDEWAKAEEDAYSRHSAALQKQIENEGKRGKSVKATRDEVKALISDLEHELSIVGQSNTMQRISNELRKVGSKATQEQREQIAALIRDIDNQKEAQERANKAQEDFKRGMEQLETDAIDALGNVIAGTEDAADAFKKLAIEIVKSALTGKGAYSDFFSSLFGGGGSILSGLFGQSFIARNGGIGLYDSGGYTGPGGVKQPAGVVHKGEVVWSQKDVARAGGVGVVEAMRRGIAGYSGGGTPGLSNIPQIRAPSMPNLSGMSQTNNNNTTNAPVINVTVNGATGNAEVAAMVQQGVATGILKWRNSVDFSKAVSNGIQTGSTRGFIR